MPSWRVVTYAAGASAVTGAIIARFPAQIARGGFRAARIGVKLGFKAGRVAGRAFWPAAVAYIAFQAARRGRVVGRKRGIAAGIEAGLARGVQEATLGIISESLAIRISKAAGPVSRARFGSRGGVGAIPAPKFDFSQLVRGLGGLFSPTSR